MLTYVRHVQVSASRLTASDATRERGGHDTHAASDASREHAAAAEHARLQQVCAHLRY
jgi:hypothetical protein